MKQPIISVQIVTWKRKGLLIDLIESLENQSIERNYYEVCVCDSGSNDGTDYAVKLLSEKYKNIKYFNIQTNTLSAKRNYLFNKTESSIIITLDDDLIVDRNFIKTHFEAHQNKNNTLFCGQVRFPENWIKKSNYYHYRDSKHLKNNIKEINYADLPAKNIVVMNMSLKKEELVDIGFMNEEFIKYGGEDQEFGIRLKNNQIKIAYLENALVYHLESSRFDQYLNKLYTAARFGHAKLVSIMPEVEISPLINYLTPINMGDKFKMIILKILLWLILNYFVVSTLKQYLKITDSCRLFYSYYLFNIVCAYSIKKGIRDQSKKTDNGAWL